MLKYVSKFAMDILPSVVATIIGAYIVNHYIVTKPDAAPVAAAVSSADPKKAKTRRRRKAVRRIRRRRQPPASRGSRRRASPKRPCSSKPPPKSRQWSKSLRKSPLTSRRRPRASRQTPAVTQPAPARKGDRQVCPGAGRAGCRHLSSPRQIPPRLSRPRSRRKSIATPTNLARAAIERLRGTGDGSPRPQEAARVPDAPRVAAAPPWQRPSRPLRAVRPLAAADHGLHPRRRKLQSGAGISQPALRGRRAIDDPRRPTPPADIPEPRRRSICAPRPWSRRREHTKVAEDMLRPRNRYFTRYCRNTCWLDGENRCFTRDHVQTRDEISANRIMIARENIVVLSGLAADARKAASRGFILGTELDGAAV